MWVGFDGYKAYMESIGKFDKTNIPAYILKIKANGKEYEFNQYSFMYEIPDEKGDVNIEPLSNEE